MIEFKSLSWVALVIPCVACGHVLAQDTCGESWLVADTDSPGSVAITYDEFRRGR